MPVKEDKSPFCVECLYVFDDNKKYHAQNKCNGCYQRLYMMNKIIKIYGSSGRPKKDIETKCSGCGDEYETLNDRGKVVKRGPKKLCRRCYARNNRPVKICNDCGNEMIKGSTTGLCVVCRIKKPTKTYVKKNILPRVDKEQFELIRRLLVRYKVGHNNMADAFRVVDIYMEVNDNPMLLDTLSEEAQLVEMLRNLKNIFYFNLNEINDIDNKNEKVIKNLSKKEYRKRWYEKNKELIKRKNILKNERKKEKIPFE